MEITLAFAGFTNYPNTAASNGAQLHVWFWFTNGSRHASYDLSAVEHLSEGRWVDEGFVYRLVHKAVPVEGFTTGEQNPHQVYLMSVPVDKPSLPLRVVFDVSEPQSGLDRIRTVLHQWWLDHVQRIAGEVYYAPSYSVTNEFHPKP
jgi:hypothetical protein